MIIFILLLLVLSFLLFPLFFPEQYISELIISFLPYLTGIALLFTLITLVSFRKRLTLSHSSVQKYYRGIFFIIFCIVFFLYSKKFNAFYTSHSFPQTSSGSYLKILFANVYEHNIEYEKLIHLISSTNPDLLLFVEFTHQQYTQLKTLLQSHYPYTNNTSRSKTFVGNMVFSKYPITNKADDFPQGAWRYGYFSVLHHGKNIYIYLVHMSSPDKYSHFVMRNRQLRTFSQDFQHHQSDRTSDHIIVVGDFNITPWSSYYTLLHTTFSGVLTNVTAYIPFLFTWKLYTFPFIQAHIDHLWISSALSLDYLEVFSLPGSDHKAFLFNIQSKY